MPLLLPGVWPPGRREPCVLQGGSPPRSVCLFEDRVSSSPAIRQSCSDSYHLGEGEGAGGEGSPAQEQVATGQASWLQG